MLPCWAGVHRLLGPCEGRQSWRRPHDTQSATSSCAATPMIGNSRGCSSGAPGSPGGLWDCELGRVRLHVLEPTFFANGAEVGGVRGRAPGSPTHPLAPGPWPTAAPGGAGREGGALHRPCKRVMCGVCLPVGCGFVLCTVCALAVYKRTPKPKQSSSVS